MKAAIYARVSTEGQQQRGTIGSQLELLRQRVHDEGHDLVAEYRDEGYSGARLDRPGLDALRDAAEAGLLDIVWCLSADRLARVYAYQVVVLDELARHGVQVRFTDAPPLSDDPQARLLTQVQGVIAEYERAKITERYRRGKLFRSRAGEVISGRVPYGYRRIPRDATTPARVEIFEPEAAIVRRVFHDYVTGGHSIRQIGLRLGDDNVPKPHGKPGPWNSATLKRLLTNESYIGQWHFNQTETVPATRLGGRPRQIPRPRQDWIPIPIPAIIDEDLFHAARRVSRDNSHFSPRRTEPGHYLLRGLVKCGTCAVGAKSIRHQSGTAAKHYYYCRNHDPVNAGGRDRTCPERHINADALDTYVFDQIRAALLRPDVLLAGEQAINDRQPTPNHHILTTELTHLQRKIDAIDTERRRLADLYQADLLDLPELHRRATNIDHRHRDLTRRRDTLTTQQTELTRDHQLRTRVESFAHTTRTGIDQLTFDQRQQLLRLIIDEVRVTGWNVQIQLRIPLDTHPTSHQTAQPRTQHHCQPKTVCVPVVITTTGV